MRPTRMPGERRWLEVSGLFLRLGLTSFGGPAAHTAMMHDEVVTRRRWLSDAEFLDLVAATNLLPGPNSTEMAIHLGRRRAGWAGFFAGGLAFILPATLIVLALSILYVRFGSTAEVEWLLYGTKPVVIAILVQALFRLGQKAIRNALSLAVGLTALAAYFTPVNEVILLLVGGAILMVAANWRRLRASPPAVLFLPLASLTPWLVGPVPFSLPLLSSPSSRSAPSCTGAVTFCSPSSTPTSSIGWAGSRSSSWSTPSPSAK